MNIFVMGNISKKIFTAICRLSIIVIIFMSLPNVGKSTHIVGGNITYKSIGNVPGGKGFTVRLTLRRDCFLGSPEAEFDNPAYVGIFSAKDGTWIRSFTMPFMSSDTLNEFIRSDCGFEGTQVCVHETTYTGAITLPQIEGGYILAYQRCCRNISLNNIIDPVSTGSTYWVAITETAYNFNNNSPTFKQWPDVYICNNKPLDFDHSATDIDGDSLVYKLCVPSSGATLINPQPTQPSPPPFAGIIWAPPYSINDLLGGVPLKINAQTGVITGTPNLVGQFLVGICVDEYRKGILLSSVRRDFQYNVRLCSQPPLAQFSTSESNCDGLRVEFYNESLSASNFRWNFNYPSTDPAFQSTETNPIFNFPSSGVYNVRLLATRGSDGCFDTIVKTVSVFENKIIPNFNFSLSGCNDTNDSLKIQLNDTSIYDEPGYTLSEWSWSVLQNGATTLYSGNNPIINLAGSGDAEVTLVVTASNGCRATIVKTINIASLAPKVDFDFSLSDCPSEGIAQLVFNNLSAPLNPFATIESISWAIGNQTFTDDPLSITLPTSTTNLSVTLTVNFVGGCTKSLTKSFSLQDLLPKADFSFQPIECPDENSVQLELTYVDTLSNGISTTDISWIVGIASNQLPYTGTDITIVIPKDSILFVNMIVNYENGCSDTVQRSFLPGPFATIKFVADPIILCPNQSKTFVTNPNPAWTYTWSPTDGLDLTDPSNPIVTIDSNITYQVTVSDGLCTVVSSVDVFALEDGITLQIEGDTTSCDGSVLLTVSGGVGVGEYIWSTDFNLTVVIATGDTLKTQFTGKEETYYAQFVGEQCSTFPAQITVSNETPSIETVSPFTVCREDTTKLLTVNLDPSHNNQFVWDADTHIVAGGNTSSPTIGIGPDENGPFVFYFTVTNQFGCSLRDSIEVIISENPVVDFSYKLSECGKNEFCFEISGTYTGFLQWNFGDPNTTNDVSLQPKPCYTYPDTGTYNVTLVNLVNVCPFKIESQDVIVNPLIAINAIDDQVRCLGDTVIFVADSNIDDVTFTWTDMNGNLVTSGNTLEIILDNDAEYIVTAEDIYGCKDTDTVRAEVFKFDFTVDLDGRDSLCINQEYEISIIIDNPSLYTYEWSPAECIVSGGGTPNPIIKAVEGKVLTVILTNKETGCASNANITPKITQPFDFQVSGPSQFCLSQNSGVTLDIDNPDAYIYLWSPAECFTSSVIIQNPTVLLTADKLLFVEVTDKLSGCKQSSEFLAEVGEQVSVEVNADPDFTIFEGESIEIFVSNPITNAIYEWSNGDDGLSIIVSPTETTSYTVTVTDENGCTATDVVTVTVRKAQCDETDVYLPNAFSPNSDGVNDILYVRSNFIDDMELIIYNRWGQEVFRSKDQTVGWDGTFNGEPLPPDAYAYYLRALCINALEYRKQGNVNLLR